MMCVEVLRAIRFAVWDQVTIILRADIFPTTNPAFNGIYSDVN